MSAAPDNYEFLEFLAICKGDSVNPENNLSHAAAYETARRIYDKKILNKKGDRMNIITGKIAKAQKIIIYGEPGAGKSTLASRFPNMLLVDVEHSSEHIDVPRVLVDSWDALLSTLTECASCQFDTIAVDTLDVVESFCATKYAIKILAPKDYGRSFVQLEEIFKEQIMPRLDAIIFAGKNVVLLAHNELKKVELPDQDGQFDRHELRLTKRVKAMFEGWCDSLLFIYRKTFVEESDSGKMKAKGGKKRWIETNSNAFCIAKTRWVGLEDNFEADIKKILPFLPNAKAAAAIPAEVKPAEVSPAQEALPTPASTPASAPTPAPAQMTPQERLSNLLALGKFTEGEMLAYLYGKNRRGTAFIDVGTEFRDIPADLIERMSKPENWAKIEASLSANRTN